VDVRALGADAYAVSLYKVFGPHVGLLFVTRDLLERCRSRNHFFLEGGSLPGKLEPGNVNYELVAALPGILEYLTGQGDGLDAAFDGIAAFEESLARPLLDDLRARDDVRILGRETADRRWRVPTVSFEVRGRTADEIPPRLEEHRIAVRYGHFYAWRAVEALGLHPKNGVVRASLVHYNNRDEVERLIAALDRIL
jgi:selenocysteine lyase/cysteine desulfurase